MGPVLERQAAVGGIGKFDAPGDAVRSAIRAYHGSPYDWDKPDLSMAKSGEGTLDEGFGLYASESPGVAEWYRSATTVAARQRLADQIRNAKRDLRTEPNNPDWHRLYRRGANSLDGAMDMRSKLQTQFPRGRVYELEVGVPEDSLLRYDVPLKWQEDLHERLRSVDPQLFDDVMGMPFVRKDDGGWGRDEGATFYQALSGGNIFDSPTVAGQREASRRMFDAGIPGHVYEGARGQKNYVFYPGTEDSIRILRKYAIPGAVGTGVASQYEESP
jgi:hypothetical protein